MIYAITYSDEKFLKSGKLNVWTATYVGKADRAHLFAPKDIDEDYYEKHKNVLSLPRGAGYWLWKPYIVLKALEQLKFDDYLMYADAGVFYVSSIHSLIKQMERDQQEILFAASFWKNSYWAKRDTFVLLECDTQEYYESRMVASGYLILKKSKKTVEFISQWLKYMEEPSLATDKPSICGLAELPNYHEHRHDNSVLSIMAKKYGYRSYRGIDGKWEIKRYSHWFKEKDRTFLGIERGEIERLYKEYLQTPETQFPLKRVIVNSNVYNRYGMAFWARIIRRLLQAWWWDHSPYLWQEEQ